MSAQSKAKSKSSNGTQPEPQWYKDAIFYELRVRSYYDANGDGVGDFEGLTRRLDYLQSLGVNALWLLPFYPSPMRDDGYDISDYTDIHHDCGTLRDFKVFLREAHERGLKVVTELVLNHTSDQHAWFQRARRAAPGSAHRDYYMWSDTPDRFRDVRIIFQDFEPSNWSWDPVAKAYYFHRFFSHQPDLNYDNPAVRREMMRVVAFWLGQGVDGLRLDAVPYLYKREGTNCENLPETHGFLRELRSYIEASFPNRMLLAEANQWPEDAVAYLAEGKECHMAFHFPLMPRIFMSVRMEDRYPLADIWAQTPDIDPSCQWALFLRNHDELTLEMVTDEERDYMYRAYAQEARMRINVGIRRRLAPLLGNNRRTIELNNALLFSLPGTPIIYYGDEIGMGDNVYLGDRDGVRTPMQWSGDRNAGFSTANPQRLILPVTIDYEYHYQTVNVEAQESNPHSLLWWMRRLIALRKQYKALGRGTIEFLTPQNPHVLAFVRTNGDERILVVSNLSRFVQYVELDLSKFKGMAPIELFGRTSFPLIGDLPYLLTLGPHGFFWFSIESPKSTIADAAVYRAPTIDVGSNGTLRAAPWKSLERILPDYVVGCRWFRSKSRVLKRISITDSVPLGEGLGAPELLLLNVDYSNAESESYLFPVAIAVGDKARGIRDRFPERIVAEVATDGQDGNKNGILYDAVVSPEFDAALLETIERHRRHRGSTGVLAGQSTRAFHQLRGEADAPLDARVLQVEQSNNSIVYGDKFILKLYRRYEKGVNADFEIGQFLTTHGLFTQVPPLTGSIEFRARDGEPSTLAIMQGFVPNQGDAWQFTLNELGHYLELAATKSVPAPATPSNVVDMLDAKEPNSMAAELMAAYLESARVLGRRVAELHLALSAPTDDPDFATEPFTTLYRRSTYQSMRNLLGGVMRSLNGRRASIPEQAREQIQTIVARQNDLLVPFDAFLRSRVSVVRMRCHGDLHLGQVLRTGKDYVIIDFEGEPARPLSERRHKRAALRDVAGMLRSFDYAAFTAVIDQHKSGALGKVDFASMLPWANFWRSWSSWAFMSGYLDAAGSGPFVPKTRDELRMLISTFTMEKAIYELGYEINNRPDWLVVPAHAIVQMIGASSPAADRKRT